jgi:hypothetical protein
MTDLDARVSALEQDSDQRKRRWVFAAAQTARLHDPAMIADRLIDRSTLTTAADADRALQRFAAENPYMRSKPEQITMEEQRRRWGEEVLDAIDRA